MQTGSLVTCVETPKINGPLLRVLFALADVAPPQRGENYVIADVRRCTCDRHNNIELQEIPSVGWDEKYFREIQPPTNVAEILGETMPVTAEAV